MPAMMEAGKIGSRAAKVGFDWPDADGIFAKLQEEIAELKAELGEANRAKIADEFGDLLFTAINLGRHLKVDTESALRSANAKFRARFQTMETIAGGYDALGSLNAGELDALWDRAKSAAGESNAAAAGGSKA
jgi:XTP/dITP diphosphohydrolase/ATP diphosphatase